MSQLTKNRLQELAGIKPSTDKESLQENSKMFGMVSPAPMGNPFGKRTSNIKEYYGSEEGRHSECYACGAALDVTNPKDDTDEGICEDCLEEEESLTEQSKISSEDEIDFDFESRVNEPDIPMEAIDKLVQAKIKDFSSSISEKIKEVQTDLGYEEQSWESPGGKYGPYVANPFTKVIETLEDVLVELEKFSPNDY